MDDGKKGFVDAMAEHQKTYRSVMSVVTEQIDVIESSLASNVPIEVLVQELNEHFKLNTNSSTVNKCLYRLRKKRPRSDKFAETANDQVTTKTAFGGESFIPNEVRTTATSEKNSLHSFSAEKREKLRPNIRNSIAASKKKSQEFFDKHDEGKLPLD